MGPAGARRPARCPSSSSLARPIVDARPSRIVAQTSLGCVQRQSAHLSACPGHPLVAVRAPRCASFGTDSCMSAISPCVNRLRAPVALEPPALRARVSRRANHAEHGVCAVLLRASRPHSHALPRQGHTGATSPREGRQALPDTSSLGAGPAAEQRTILMGTATALSVWQPPPLQLLRGLATLSPRPRRASQFSRHAARLPAGVCLRRARAAGLERAPSDLCRGARHGERFVSALNAEP